MIVGSLMCIPPGLPLVSEMISDHPSFLVLQSFIPC